MAASQVPSTLAPQGQTGTTAVATTDIHQGDHFVEILGATAVCTVIGFLAPSIGGGAYLAWLGDIVLIPLSLARAWQRVKWSSVRLPAGGYLAFAKGKYLSGHAKLRQPEDAVLGLTNDSVCISTIGGQLEAIHLMNVITPVTRDTQQGRDVTKIMLKLVLLLWRPILAFVGAPAKRDIYVLNVQHKIPPGMLGRLRFVVDGEDKADEMINHIEAGVQHSYSQMAAGVQVQQPRKPTPTWP